MTIQYNVARHAFNAGEPWSRVISRWGTASRDLFRVAPPCCGQAKTDVKGSIRVKILGIVQSFPACKSFPSIDVSNSQAPAKFSGSTRSESRSWSFAKVVFFWCQNVKIDARRVEKVEIGNKFGA